MGNAFYSYFAPFRKGFLSCFVIGFFVPYCFKTALKRILAVAGFPDGIIDQSGNPECVSVPVADLRHIF